MQVAHPRPPWLSGSYHPQVENTGQIMWPQDRIEGLGSGPFHARCELLAEYLMGSDMSFDFDMLIYKDPQTRTETPWHQDEVRRGWVELIGNVHTATD